MSKVYEALRQKEHENSTLSSDQPPVDRASVVENASDAWDPTPFDLEPEITDPVLRAAFGIVEKKRVEVPSASLPFYPPAPEISSEPLTESNSYPPLSVGSRKNSRLVFQTDPHGLAAEQLRFLRRTLEQKFSKGAALLVTSPAPKDGKTLTSLNLSSCLADSGRSTLLVEADVRQPSVRRLLGGEETFTGVEDAIAGTVSPDKAVRFVQESSLHVSMVARPPAEPSRLISGRGLKQFLDWARGRFHWIVIDSPPVLPAADVTHLMPLADAVLAVVRTHSTPRVLAVRAFEIIGNRLSGVILNGATIESNPYYRYLSEYRDQGAVPSRIQSAGSNTEQIDATT